MDDEEHTRNGLELALEDEFEVFCASSAKEAEMALNQEDFQVGVNRFTNARRIGYVSN